VRPGQHNSRQQNQQNPESKLERHGEHEGDGRKVNGKGCMLCACVCMSVLKIESLETYRTKDKLKHNHGRYKTGRLGSRFLLFLIALMASSRGVGDLEQDGG
jgi:hypothetical protein